MQKETQIKRIHWLKRGLGVTAILLWIYVIFSIAQSSDPFMTQAPYCMVSTMLIFGLLTAIHKGLEQWQEKLRS